MSCCLSFSCFCNKWGFFCLFLWFFFCNFWVEKNSQAVRNSCREVCYFVCNLGKYFLDIGTQSNKENNHSERRNNHKFHCCENGAASLIFFFQSFFALCAVKVDTRSAHSDGTLTMMSPGVSSRLSKQLNGRENVAICLKGKLRRSIGFSLQLCFHTAAEEGRLALLNETLGFPSSPHLRVSPWLPSPVTAMIRERWDEYVRRDLILLNATSPVNSCQFCHCRFQAVSRLCSWMRVGRGSTRRPDLPNSCTLLNYPSLSGPTFQRWS